MAQVIVEDLDPTIMIIMQKLEARANRYERSLQAELKTILEQAALGDLVQVKTVHMVTARERAARTRQELSGCFHTDSAEFLREDRDR